MKLFLTLPLAVGLIAGVAPAQLEINFGPMPIDRYKSIPDPQNPTNRNPYGGAILTSCPATGDVRQCIKKMFNSNSSDPHGMLQTIELKALLG